MTDKKLEDFLKTCHEEVQLKQKELIKQTQLNTYTRYVFSQNEKRLTLSKDTGDKLYFKMICIGSWHTKEKGWSWAWGNKSLTEELREDAKCLKELEEKTGYAIFNQEAFECEEAVAIDLAFAGVYFLNAIGIYRITVEESYVFLALMAQEESEDIGKSLDWSLEKLYSGFEENAYQADLKQLDKALIDFNEWVEEVTQNHQNEGQKLEEYIDRIEKISLLFERLGVFAELKVSVQSKDELANKYADKIDQKQSLLAQPETKMSEWISNINHIETVIQASDKLKAYEFFLQEIIRNHQYLLSEKEEVMLAKMKNTGSTAWVNYKNLLISNHKVEIKQEDKQEVLPLTVVLNMAYDKNKEVRKRAYEAEIASYKSIEDGIAAALNAIKGEVLTVSELRGYSSPLDMTLEDSRMKRETLEAMLSAMQESMPMFRKYLRRKAELLGYSKGLPFYELYAPIINQEIKYTYDQGKAFVERQFRSFSNDLGDYARRAMDQHWIDVLPKEGKVGGAFCCAVHSIGESRILLNYGDNLGDTITMAHELGHGYHGECLKQESILNTHYPMPLAETASTFCETIVKKAAIKEGNKEEAIAILETEISDCTQVIVDIYSRYLFETDIFEKRKQSPLTVEEIKESMLKAQREAYGEGLDPDYLHPYMWTWKSHYYYADANFYNFPYAFGLLFAKGLYAKYLEDREGFPRRYKQLLGATGKMTIEEVAKTIGIDISSPKFWRDSLKTIKEDIEEFMKLSGEI